MHEADRLVEQADQLFKERKLEEAFQFYSEAGLLYEREGDFEKYSHCFIESKNAFLEYLWYVFISGKRQDRIKQTTANASWLDHFGALLESLSGFVMVPMLVIALTRRYLRVYR